MRWIKSKRRYFLIFSALSDEIAYAGAALPERRPMPASGGYAVETDEETFHALKNSKDVFYDRAAGTIVAFPEKPNAYAYYDRSARAWATDIAAAWDAVRSARGALLAGCDWTQLADAALSNTEKARWQEYRQALRDITSQGGPLAIVWPVPPNS